MSGFYNVFPKKWKMLFGLVALAAAWCGVVGQADAAKRDGKSPEKLNVLFIPVDDLNDWPNYLGGSYQKIHTPNLDRLAGRGVFFSRAYCSAPACNPSRASLLCGIRPSTSGVYYNSNPWRAQLPDAVTLPQYFMAADYLVHGGGKVFHGGFKDPESWQVYFNRPDDPKPEILPANGIPKTSHFDWGPVQEGDEAMGDTQVVDWAVEFLNQKHDKPFFLAAGMFRPHLPWYAPQKYFDKYPLPEIVLPTVPEDDLDDIPGPGIGMAKPQGDHAKVTASDNWEKAVQGYLASITYVDGQIGRLVEALEASPYADNTVIVLWTDHGWHLGEKRHWRKFALWEEATRVPMIWVVPGLTKPGSRCDRTVSLLDIYPTLADVCGLPVGEQLEGKSLKPLLADPAAAWDRPVVTTHGRNNHAVRSERWRYIRYHDGSEELYDHENDPMEWANLADKTEHQAVKKELADRLPKVNVDEGPRGRKTRKQPAKQRDTKVHLPKTSPAQPSR